MLKYHIQTSGRSCTRAKIQFNYIRTTLQALYALFENCNSLHTNAYDERSRRPPRNRVRRAVAIQLIINKELGLNRTQQPVQGSFAIDALTDLVEEAVYREFDRLSERGGVLGRHETMLPAQQDPGGELYYETLKHDGRLPTWRQHLPRSDDARSWRGAADPLDRGGEAAARCARCARSSSRNRGTRPRRCGGCSPRPRAAATCSPSSWRR